MDVEHDGNQGSWRNVVAVIASGAMAVVLGVVVAVLLTAGDSTEVAGVVETATTVTPTENSLESTTTSTTTSTITSSTTPTQPPQVSTSSRAPAREPTAEEVLQADITELKVDAIFDYRCNGNQDCENASATGFGHWVCERSIGCTFDGSPVLEYANGSWRTVSRLSGWTCGDTNTAFGLTLTVEAAFLGDDGRVVASEALMTLDTEPPCRPIAVDFRLSN